MATTGRQSAAVDLAATLREAGLVRLAPAATGDGVAAAGVLARALEAIDVPYQVSVATADATRGTEADVTLALDRPSPGVDRTLGTDRPASAVAFDVARSLTDDIDAADPALAAAGVLAAGVEPTGQLADALADAGIDRRPGVAVPTDDVVDGLAHSTRLHASFSGDPDAVREALTDATTEPTDDEDRRRVASLVAVMATDGDAPPRAAESIAAALRPHAGGPLTTLEGYGDVLDAAVREDPGAAVAIAVGHETAREDALEAWRIHARAVHRTLAETSIRRHAGLVVADADDRIETVARLLRDYRSPEPLALVAGDDRVALAAADERDAATVLDEATAAFDLSGRVVGDDDLATQAYPGDVDRLVAAIREVSTDA